MKQCRQSIYFVLLKSWIQGTVWTFFSVSLSFAQTKEPVATGYLMDPAEEYWPATNDSTASTLQRIKHIAAFAGKGSLSIGGSFRENYDYFDNYLWGRGPQDHNGYLLHRGLLHADVRVNSHLRFFGELGCSLISGRNGGARPVQDLNRLAANQMFTEYSGTISGTRYALRVGKQALHYGVGTLLDIRDANVHRSFTGVKLIAEHAGSRIDLFYMQLVKTGPGSFDDKRDPGERVIGGWYTRKMNHTFQKIDLYLLLTHRDNTLFNQGAGREDRQTLGTNLTYASGEWSGILEADYQTGRFQNATISAWKATFSLNRRVADLPWKPTVSFNAALSSGDKDPKNPKLQTFSPIYPKGIYYGFIDIAGSANILLVHPKLAFEPSKKLKFSAGYYLFWRESLQDGLYAPNGAFFLSADNDERHAGNMVDVITAYTFNPNISLQTITTRFTRGNYLKNMQDTPHNTFYTGLSALLKF